MSFNDNAVFTASTGYVYKAAPGTPSITPEELANFDPETYGASTQALTITGSPTGGTFTVTVGGKDSEPIPYDASAAQVQDAVAKITGVGSGNVVVTGVDAKTGYTLAFVGDLFNTDPDVAITSALTGGTSATAKLAEATKASGWEPVGHTAEEELPEFGYEGGETESKGSWQKKNLRQVSTEAPVDYVTIKANQFDIDTLELYYGKNASKVANIFGVDDASAKGIDRAFQIIMVDGDFKIAFSSAKATVARDESITLATDEFSILPLRATFVKFPGRHLFEWILPS